MSRRRQHPNPEKPLRIPRPPPTTLRRCYLRGRLHAAGLLGPTEAAAFLAANHSPEREAAFLVGGSAAPDDPILSEGELLAAVVRILSGD